LVGAPIYLLIVAAVGLFIVNVMFGATTEFKADFSVVCYAYLVGLVGGLLALVVILFGDAEQFNPQNFIPSNLGFFLNPRETSKPLYAIASSFDVFTVWFLVLAALGLSTATAKKVRTIPIFAIFVGLWAVWVLVKAGLSMVGG
jgi:FtsH-binding integral membrane protein